MSIIYLSLSILAGVSWIALHLYSVVRDPDTLSTFTLFLVLPLLAGFLLGLSGIEQRFLAYTDLLAPISALSVIMTGLILSFIHSRLNTAIVGAIYGISALVFMCFLTVALIAQCSL